jgi:hypothetical protein
MKETESQIVSAICDYLAARRHFFWRQNTSPTVNKTADGWSFRRMPKHALKGVPDIILIKPGGRFVGLEVKTETGRVSVDQLAFATNCRIVGGEYHVVRSIDDARALGL